MFIKPHHLGYIFALGCFAAGGVIISDSDITTEPDSSPLSTQEVHAASIITGPPSATYADLRPCNFPRDHQVRATISVSNNPSTNKNAIWYSSKPTVVGSATGTYTARVAGGTGGEPISQADFNNLTDKSPANVRILCRF